MALHLRESVRLARRLVRCAMGREVFYRRQVRCPRLQLGTEYGRHCICPSGIDSGTVVYSFGVGTDVSFDLALIERFGVQVHAFDPSPIAVRWVQEQALPEQFHFHDFGVLDRDGTVTFHPPVRAGWDSYSVVDESARPVANNADSAVVGPVYRLETIMQKLGHDHIDILKLDVEGAEYDVIDDMRRADLDVRQLLVEFHHQYAGPQRARQALAALNRGGYRIFDVSAGGANFSLIR